MSRLTQYPAVGAIDLFQVIDPTTTTSANYDSKAPTYIGEKFVSSDGREFVLVSAGAVALATGKLMQSAALITNHQNMTTSTASAGATSVTVTLGATAVTANQYAGGFVTFNAGTGAGQTLRIASHPAAALSTTCVLTLEDPIVTATATADTKSSLAPNPYAGIVVHPTVSTNSPAGVTLYGIAAGLIGLIQTKGQIACLNDAGTTIGLGVAPSTNTAGAVMTVGATTNQVGSAAFTGTTTEYSLINIRL
jgi:hypothetical protein